MAIRKRMPIIMISTPAGIHIGANTHIHPKLTRILRPASFTLQDQFVLTEDLNHDYPLRIQNLMIAPIPRAPSGVRISYRKALPMLFHLFFFFSSVSGSYLGAL